MCNVHEKRPGRDAALRGGPDVHTYVQNHVQTVENFVKSGVVRHRNTRLYVQKSISGYFSRSVCEHGVEKMNFLRKGLDRKSVQKGFFIIAQKMSGILRYFRVFCTYTDIRDEKLRGRGNDAPWSQASECAEMCGIYRDNIRD